MDVLIPNLGDIDEVEVIEITVSPGDQVQENDGLIVIESDKASMEVPCPSDGVVEEILVTVGDMVGEGHPVAKIRALDGTNSEQSDLQELPDISGEESATNDVASPNRIDFLIPDLGNTSLATVKELLCKPGEKITAGSKLILLEADEEELEITSEFDGVLIDVCVSENQLVSSGDLVAQMEANAALEENQPIDKAVAPADQELSDDEEVTLPNVASVYAGPAVRRLAREYGVTLEEISGSGKRGRITKDDLKAHVKTRLSNVTESTFNQGLPEVETINFSKFGETSSLALSRIQQVAAKNLHASWVNLPHVTQHDKVDVTDLEDFRSALNAETEDAGGKITPLAFIVRASCLVLQDYPIFNASLEPSGKSVLVNQFFNIGFAFDTPDGLVVPVIKEADKKGLRQISSEISDLSEKAREKKLAMNDLQGGTFTISSLGPLGGTGFTPIVNAPQVAILGVARMDIEPVWTGDQFSPRKVLPLSLSYDHRVINGADGGRFMNSLTRLLGDIRRLSL